MDIPPQSIGLSSSTCRPSNLLETSDSSQQWVTTRGYGEERPRFNGFTALAGIRNDCWKPQPVTEVYITTQSLNYTVQSTVTHLIEIDRHVNCASSNVFLICLGVIPDLCQSNTADTSQRLNSYNIICHTIRYHMKTVSTTFGSDWFHSRTPWQ